MAEQAVSGFRALLFSDLRGYTAFVEARGDAEAAALLSRYRATVRDVIGRFAGAEIRTEGDSFYVVFASASSAVRAGMEIISAARDATLAQGRYPIAVGIGIHAGETTDTSEGPVGSAVNIAARLCSLARPGELLVSETVRGLVRTSVEAAFIARGRRHLKGVREPMITYSVTPDGAAWPGVETQSVKARVGRSQALLASGLGVLVLLVVGGLFLRPAARQSQDGTGASPAPGSFANAAGTTMLPSASVPSGPPNTPRAEATAFPTAMEQLLLDHVPRAILPRCRRSTTGDGGLGGQAGVRCELLAEDADTVWYDEFVTRATAKERFDRLVRDAKVGEGECNASVTAAAGTWRLGSGTAGDLLCYTEHGTAWLIWTYVDQPIIAQASRADGNAAALFGWWEGVGPFLR